MIKIFVDSGSSIKQNEKGKYGVEILPLRISFGDKEYLDGVDLSHDEFYELLKNGNFPKTSLPSLLDAEHDVKKCVDEGYDVIVLTISSGISGTHNALKNLFSNEPKVRVIDSKSAVGGMKLLVLEANKYLNESLDFVEEKINALIPRIKILAVPETLDYLHKGGRLSKAAWAFGTILKIKPIMSLSNTVKVVGKTIGIKPAMKYLRSELEKCDLSYPIIPSYTHVHDNLDELIEKTADEYKNVMIEKDDIDLAIAAHWGPGTFAYIFVEK